MSPNPERALVLDEILRAWQRDGYDRLLPEALATKACKFPGLYEEAAAEWAKHDVRLRLVPPTFLPLADHWPRTREQVLFQRLVQTLEKAPAVTARNPPQSRPER